jgi:hypothetical protein
MNDSYVGFDCETLLEFKIVKDDTTRVIPDYDKETVAALKGPGLVQSLLDTGAGESSAEESDDDHEEKFVERQFNFVSEISIFVDYAVISKYLLVIKDKDYNKNALIL